MRILVIGSGGREHALVWKIAHSKLVDKIFCAPGNGGISDIAECLDIKADDVCGLLDFARREKIDLTVVGPEASLVAGVTDEFGKHKLPVFGPSKNAARIEGSKVFAKQLMAKYGVPTAACKVFDDLDAALRHLNERPMPCVIKADGLAAGKGVVVANDISEASRAVLSIMKDRLFADAGNRVVIEECLFGQEASILVLTDGRSVVPLASSQDHKRVFDADRGPNTGGMGAYSPAPVVSDKVMKEVMDKVIYPAIGGLAKEGIDYRGVLYAGIMITEEGPQTLEFNARFGDPETQVILTRMESDFVEVMMAVCEGSLCRFESLKWSLRPSVCVVCSSGGYPGEFQKGKEISGLQEASQMKDVVVFHAGTRKAGGKYLTSGGRVLGVTGLGETIPDAISRAYGAVDKIKFQGMHFRSDIGKKALQ